jgi:hypothetical protein
VNPSKMGRKYREWQTGSSEKAAFARPDEKSPLVGYRVSLEPFLHDIVHCETLSKQQAILERGHRPHEHS